MQRGASEITADISRAAVLSTRAIEQLIPLQYDIGTCSLRERAPDAKISYAAKDQMHASESSLTRAKKVSSF